jgi:hypothetical protein
MFKFLKKLFTEPKKEELKPEELKPEELGKWFNEESNKIFTELNIKLDDIKNKIKEETTKTKENLAILNAANLHNPKISVREKQFMEGNRRAYILSVNTFLRGLEIEKEDPSKLLEFCNNFNKRIENFGKSTVRSYHILQEFFSNESKTIAINIRRLGSHVSELENTIKQAKTKKIQDIKQRIDELNNKIKQRTELDISLKNKEKLEDSSSKNKIDTEKEIENLIKSKEYKHLLELKANKEISLTHIREHNAKIVHAFSVMERPLKKLLRVIMEDHELLNKYLENPVETLVSDNELKITKILHKLERNINNYTLDLKDKKRDRVLETIKGTTEEFLREFINKHNELEENLKNIEKDIEENQSLKTEEKLRYELSNIDENIEKTEKEIGLIKKEIEKTNIHTIKEMLQNEINDVLKVDVVIG